MKGENWRGISRREFLKLLGIGAVTFGLGTLLPLRWVRRVWGKSGSELVVAENGSPQELTRAAISLLGGMGKFVKKGDRVLVKPNIAFNRRPEQAATVHPEVVKTLVQLCYQAGAGRVIVEDHTCHNWRMTYKTSGIEKAAREAGAIVRDASQRRLYQEVDIPRGKVLKRCLVLRDVLDADVVINVPIAKVHGSAKVTLSMKNLMGIIWDRGYFHRTNLHQCIADLSTRIRPALTLLDATRILTTRGPSGPGKVVELRKVVAGVDPVAVDAYGTALLGFKGRDIPHILLAHQMGVGEVDLGKVSIKKVDARSWSLWEEVKGIFS